MGNPTGCNVIMVPSTWEMAGNELQRRTVPAKVHIAPQYAWAAATIPQECRQEKSLNVKLNIKTPFAL